jgi:hypothetical protein
MMSHASVEFKLMWHAHLPVLHGRDSRATLTGCARIHDYLDRFKPDRITFRAVQILNRPEV